MINVFISILAAVILGQVDVELLQQEFMAEARASSPEPPRLALQIQNSAEQISLGPKINAKSALVIDAATGKILYSKNITHRQPIASISKLMTALVFLEHNPGWDKEIVFKKEYQREGSRDLFYPREITTTKDLFYAGLMMSNNSAIAALAVSTGFTEQAFVSLMNAKARELGLRQTVFTDPTGYDNGNISTVMDVAQLARHAFKQDSIKEATTQGRYTIKIINSSRSFFVFNTNQLLGSFLNQGDYKIIGGKTGHLDAAGYCLVTQIKNNKGGEILSVVLGSETTAGRFNETKGIVDWVFERYLWP